MTLSDRLNAVMTANPNLPPHLCLRRAVTAHRLAQAAEMAMQHHPDAPALIAAELAQRERPEAPNPQMTLLDSQEARVR